MSENKVRYNEGWIGRVGEEPGEGMGYLELWVGKEELKVHETPTGDEVGELNMNGRFASPSGIPYALGDGILGEDGVLFVHAAFWRYQLDAIKKMNPQKGQRYRIAGKFVVDSYQKKDGTVGTSVRINVQKFQMVYTNKTEKSEVSEEKTEAPKEAKKTKATKSKSKAEAPVPEFEVPF